MFNNKFFKSSRDEVTAVSLVEVDLNLRFLNPRDFLSRFEHDDEITEVIKRAFRTKAFQFRVRKRLTINIEGKFIRREECAFTLLILEEIPSDYNTVSCPR